MTTTAFAASPAEGSYEYDNYNDRDFFNNSGVLERYGGTNNYSAKITDPRAQAQASFTPEERVVSAVKDNFWADATAYPIEHKFVSALNSNTSPANAPTGTAYFKWNGPMLYMLVEVTGDTTAATATNQAWSAASFAPAANNDGIVVGFDVFNDKLGMETDNCTWFYVGSNGARPNVFNNSGIPSLGSFLNTANLNYSPRVAAQACTGYDATTNRPGVNYTYEVALQIEGWGDEEALIGNGREVGIEIGIMDGNQSWTFWSKTDVDSAREGSSNQPNDERTRNRDWGEITLAGWDGEAAFAYSDFRATEAVRFWNSPSNPGAGGNHTGTGDGSLSNVWSAETKQRMVDAVEAFEAVKGNPAASRSEKEAAINEVDTAFKGLRWVEDTFPDPHDLPILNTIPDPYKFFDESKGTDGYVTNLEEWKERKAEILALAEFYEYGYKPRRGQDYDLVVNSVNYSGTGNAVINVTITPTNTGHWSGGQPLTTNITVTNPATAAAAVGGKAGPGFGLTNNGFASTSVISIVGDTRTDSIWTTRNSNFHTLFPHQRNVAGTDVSASMTYATSVTLSLDAIEEACKINEDLAAVIDVNKAATSGFSFQGKYAWVAAAWDERVAIAFPGAAGATGPANWRYNVQGQEYNFADTPFYAAGADKVVAFGNEGPGNSYRHNRVRETELFRHFMDNGHMYSFYDGAYAYGRYGSMPVDNALIAATFAPDRIIVLVNCINDFNDGAGGDNMSFQLARSVYAAFGANPDEHVFFDSSNYASSGDPHGGASGRIDQATIASDLIHGTKNVTEAQWERLLTDPFELDVCGPNFSQEMSAYDYYWGGFNTITGGKDGINGTDGWYYTGLPSAAPSVSLNGDVGAMQGEDLKYTVSVSHIDKLATATLWFEVEDAFFTGKSFQGLNGFKLLDNVVWTQDGDKWIGRATIANMDGGVSTSQSLEIFEMLFTSKEALGTTSVKLTKVQLSGYNDLNEAVYLEAKVLKDSVSVTIGEFFSGYDVNRDGKIDQLDLTTAQLYYMAKEGDANWNLAQRADVNGDGIVDISDFITILNNIVW